MNPSGSCRLVAAFLVLSFLPVLAQTAATGTVAGTIFDAANGQPVRGATIEVVGIAAQTKAVTDTDGRYLLSLPPGNYNFKITAQNYLAAELEGVVVSAGESTEASTVMAAANAVTTVEVKEKVGAIAATAEAATQERKLAATVSDSMSGEEIRKTVASDAAGAVEKVTGVSIVDSGYVYVRGLGERYSATMLNNALVPTTEPERRVVPLDLFPANLIDQIKVLKTYTPDLPGEFAGGLVQMTTVEFPAQKLLRVGMSYGFNTRTTFGRFESYPGGGRDFFGFDDGNRSIPGNVPGDARLFRGNFTQQQFQEFGRSFPVNWEPTSVTSMRPSLSYNVVGGNTFGRIGVVGAVTFANSPQRYGEQQRFLNVSGGRPNIFSEYTNYVADSESVRLGAVFNAAIKLNSANKLVFRNTLTRDTDKEARTFSGLNGGIDGIIQAQRLRWVERAVLSTGVEGEHLFARLGNSLLRWQMTYSSSTRDEPDL
ncbi:MAG TPA: hypothetical protein DEH78_01030, partial [Solibacterales bacterium]|nr:hypothetical protein [Bryobacterales bacterium]